MNPLPADARWIVVILQTLMWGTVGGVFGPIAFNRILSVGWLLVYVATGFLSYTILMVVSTWAVARHPEAARKLLWSLLPLPVALGAWCLTQTSGVNWIERRWSFAPLCFAALMILCGKAMTTHPRGVKRTLGVLSFSPVGVLVVILLSTTPVMGGVF